MMSCPDKSGVPKWVFSLLTALAVTACASNAPISPAVVDTLALRALSDRVDNGDFGRIAAIVASRNGSIVFEDYFGRHTAEGTVDMRSAGKSLTALAVGIAIEDGAISDIDTPVFPVFADYAPIAHDGEVKQATTLRDLLTMRSSMLCDDWQDSPGNENRMYRTRNWTRFALDIPVDPDVAARGSGYSRFSYCTAGVFLVGQMLERKTGVRFDQFVGDRIFAPLGISEVEWTTSPIGEIQSGGQISLRARDAERLGCLVLNDGQWNGEQIVPRAWITEMLEPVSAPGPGLSYGYLWWISSFRVGDTEQDFEADLMLGNGGNLVVVIPALDAVVVVQAQNYNDPADLTLSRAIVERFILPALMDPLAAN